MSDPKMMPIMQGKCLRAIPWALIAPHEDQAQDNHYQTLNKLAQRGGLGADEAVAILEDRQWRAMDEREAEFRLIALIAAMSQ